MESEREINVSDFGAPRGRLIKTVPSLGALALAATLFSSGASAAAVLYTNAADFAAATAGLTFDDFETSTFTGFPAPITFTGGSIACTGVSFCSFFFGNQLGGGLALSGVKAPYFATPDTLTFSFTTPITAFGIFVGGSGDVGTQNLSVTLTDGTTFVPYPNYSNGSETFQNNTLFVGITSDTPFSTVAFTGAPISDGVFFDNLSYGVNAAQVPLPSTLLLLGAGFAALAAARRRGRAS